MLRVTVRILGWRPAASCGLTLSAELSSVDSFQYYPYLAHNHLRCYTMTFLSCVLLWNSRLHESFSGIVHVLQDILHRTLLADFRQKLFTTWLFWKLLRCITCSRMCMTLQVPFPIPPSRIICSEACLRRVTPRKLSASMRKRASPRLCARMQPETRLLSRWWASNSSVVVVLCLRLGNVSVPATCPPLPLLRLSAVPLNHPLHVSRVNERTVVAHV